MAAAIFALLAIAPGPSRAADNAKANVSLSDTTTEVGQSVEYRIDIVGANGGSEPQAPKVDGLTITESGKQSSHQITGSLGGGIEVVNTTTYTFNVEPSRAGRFVIPGQQIDTGAGAVLVKPVALTVGGSSSGGAEPSDPSRAVFARLSLAKKSAYVGEAIPAEVKAFFGANVAAQTDPNLILNGEGFTAQKFTAPRQDVETVDGSQYRVVTYRTSLAGAKVGTLTVGPADTEAIVRMSRNKPRRRPNFSNPFDDDPFFRDPFGAFNEMVTKQVRLRAEPQTLEIKPLPPGAPKDFSGAIGHFTLEAEAEPRKVQAGDPVTVKLHLSGQGNFDRVNAPVLSDDTGLRAYPPGANFKADPADELGLSGTKTFDQSIVSQTGRKALPSYHFSYFDPETSKYVSLQTPPISVTVEGPTALPPTPAPAQAAPTAAPSPTPTPKPRDILYIRMDSDRPASFEPVYWQRSFWVVQGAIGLGLAAAGGWALGRSRGAARRRAAESQRQQAQLLQALQTATTPRRDFYSAAARLAQLKAAAATGRPGAYLSAAEICAAKGVDAQTAARVEEIFRRHDELAYSGGRSAEEPAPTEERRTILQTLETI